MSEDWTEKYRPRSLKEVLGTPKAVETMRLWAQRWTDGEPEVKALILSGEPGTGKTSAAMALAADFNWGSLELNASDARNKDTIEAVALSGSVNETFTSTGEFRPSREGGRKLIILDEADNLYERAGSGGAGPEYRERLVRKTGTRGGDKDEGTGDGEQMVESAGKKGRETSGDAGVTWEVEKVKVADMTDRGGKGAIIKTIRSTHQPVILIVNDLYALTKGSGVALKSLCQTVRFNRISHSSVTKALTRICGAEGIDADPAALDILARNAGGDLRSAINDLQASVWDRTRLGPEDISAVGERDSKPGTFDAVAALFSAVSVAAARGAMENLDESPEQFILWVDENLPRAYQAPGDLDAGYRRLARADAYLGISRRTQVYRFWAYARDMMSAGVALAKGPAGVSPGRYNFPQYLMKMSRSKGQRRLRDESCGILARYTHSSTADIRVNYINYYKYLMKNHHELSVNIARRTRMDATTLAYLLDRKATSADVKEILKAAVEGTPSDKRPSIDLGRAVEVEEEEDGPWPSGGSGANGGMKADTGAKKGKEERKKGEKEGKKGEKEGGDDEAKGRQKSLFDY